MMAPVLSALITVHDEEDQLAECLECLAFADEIVERLGLRPPGDLLPGGGILSVAREIERV